MLEAIPMHWQGTRLACFQDCPIMESDTMKSKTLTCVNRHQPCRHFQTACADDLGVRRHNTICTLVDRFGDKTSLATIRYPEGFSRTDLGGRRRKRINDCCFLERYFDLVHISVTSVLNMDIHKKRIATDPGLAMKAGGEPDRQRTICSPEV